MEVRRASDVEGQSGGAAKRGLRIKLWHWIVIVGFAALATDIALRLRSVPETSQFRQPSAAEMQALEKEFDQIQKRLEKTQQEFTRDSATTDEVLRQFESMQDGSKDLRTAPRSPDGTGFIIQL